MTDDVSAQYEAYPYPARDPEEERKRLIEGSPSDPVEIDHFLFGGARDWTRPFRALVAGGGTGDGLIQLAAKLTAAGRPFEITYVDPSRAARAVAEARAKVRGLESITFVTGSLMEAGALGRFDYIDCCGVLHHLPDPVAGFAALRGALAPGGGIGFMVYAPYGRSGVYPLQVAFGALLEGLAPEQRLARGREIFARVPEGHPFRRNPHLGDHSQSDAGFYDLLLHTRDVAMDVPAVLEALHGAGLELSGFVKPALYDLSAFCPVPESMDPGAAMALAERLRGTIKVHIGYAVTAGAGTVPATGRAMSAVPHLKGAKQLATGVAKGQAPVVRTSGAEVKLTFDRAAAPLIAAVDGRRSLGEIAARAGVDPLRFTALWGPVERDLCGWGLMLYSRRLLP